MSQTSDAQFARTFTIVIALLAIFGFAVALIGRYIEHHMLPKDADSAASARIAPVGQSNTGDPIVPARPEGAAVATADGDPGKRVYETACVACHATPALGAPVFGNKDDWAPRIAQGMDVLYTHSLNGFQGEKGVMPPKGGRMDLTDDEVKAGVDYMVNAAGGAAPAATPAPASPAAAAAVAAAPAAEATVPTADAGKAVYDKACTICHASGVAGAPKLGDKEGWSKRVAQGMETLHSHAINGYMGEAGLMPPKGGRADLSDEEVKAAVDYMVNASK